MPKRKVGAHFTPSEPVKRISSEGPLDQMLGVHIDENMASQVYLASVLNEDDLFERCPVIGEIDFDSEIGGDSIKELLKEEQYITNELFTNPSGEGLQRFAEVSVDCFGVNDADWMSDPEALIWKSALLSQLRAKYNAITHFINNAGAVDFSGDMSVEDRTAVASRARELAARLKDQVLSEIDVNTHNAADQLRTAVSETKARFKKYVVTTQSAKDTGGLTDGDIEAVCRDGE